MPPGARLANSANGLRPMVCVDLCTYAPVEAVAFLMTDPSDMGIRCRCPPSKNGCGTCPHASGDHAPTLSTVSLPLTTTHVFYVERRCSNRVRKCCWPFCLVFMSAGTTRCVELLGKSARVCRCGSFNSYFFDAAMPPFKPL